MTHPSPATSIRSRTIAAIATSLLPLLWLCAGCGRSPDPEAEAAAARLQAEQARAAEQLSALSNQLAAARQAQDETARNLAARLEELDQRTAAAQAAREELARSQAEQTAAKEEQARKSLERIAQLEGEVAALQAGRLLPEITLPPDDAPTPQELEQQIKIVERKRELAAEEVEIRAKALPQLTVGAQGVSFRSADTNFAFRLRGLVQLDSHTFFDDDEYAEGNDSFLLRRARPIIEGTVFRDFDFQLVPDFGMSSTRLFDAWMNYRYRPELQLKAGKFKGPVGLEQLQSDATLPFNERGLVSNFMPTRSVGCSCGVNLPMVSPATRRVFSMWPVMAGTRKTSISGTTRSTLPGFPCDRFERRIQSG
jgi:chemotaxis protein histidine kinase CheA